MLSTLLHDWRGLICCCQTMFLILQGWRLVLLLIIYSAKQNKTLFNVCWTFTADYKVVEGLGTL